MRAPQPAQRRDLEGDLAGVSAPRARAHARNTFAAFAGRAAPSYGPADGPHLRATVAEGFERHGSITLRPSVLRADLCGEASSAGQEVAVPQPAADPEATVDVHRQPHSASEPPAALLQQLQAVESASPDVHRLRGDSMPAPQQPVGGSVMLAQPPLAARLLPTRGAEQVASLWKRPACTSVAELEDAEAPRPSAPATSVQAQAPVQTDAAAPGAASATPTATQRRSTVPDLSPEDMAGLFTALDRKTMSQREFLEALFAASDAAGTGSLPLGLAGTRGAHADDEAAPKGTGPGVLDEEDAEDGEERISAQPDLRSMDGAA